VNFVARHKTGSLCRRRRLALALAADTQQEKALPMRVNVPVTDQEYVLPKDEILVSRTTPKGVIPYASDAFVHSSGFSREELLGQAHDLVRYPDMPTGR
jgi:hypothetical protein